MGDENGNILPPTAIGTGGFWVPGLGMFWRRVKNKIKIIAITPNMVMIEASFFIQNFQLGGI